jgi:hypothetical protein
LIRLYTTTRLYRAYPRCEVVRIHRLFRVYKTAVRGSTHVPWIRVCRRELLVHGCTAALVFWAPYVRAKACITQRGTPARARAPRANTRPKLACHRTN